MEPCGNNIDNITCFLNSGTYIHRSAHNIRAIVESNFVGIYFCGRRELCMCIPVSDVVIAMPAEVYLAIWLMTSRDRPEWFLLPIFWLLILYHSSFYPNSSNSRNNSNSGLYHVIPAGITVVTS